VKADSLYIWKVGENHMASKTVDESGDVSGETQGSGLEPNLAGALSYLLGIITGVVFFAVDKENDFVRFHAAQSIVLSVAVIVVNIFLSVVTGILTAIAFAGAGAGAFGMFGIVSLLFNLVWGVFGLAVFLVWLYMMFTAYQGDRTRLPLLAGFADRLAES